MRVRFTAPAARELDRILAHLAEQSGLGEKRVGRRIREKISLLGSQPHAGQPTDRPGTRRLVVSPFPYLIFYRVEEREVVITAVRHAAQRPM